eukprot:scaffold100550_cov57-Attheya_sp.AAC.2
MPVTTNHDQPMSDSQDDGKHSVDISGRQDNSSSTSDYDSSSESDDEGYDAERSDTQLMPVSPAARNPADSSRAEFLDDLHILSSCRVWDITISRTLPNQPIKESHLLLMQWAKLSIKNLEPTPSMKLGYKRLRDGHCWMELPPNPPCILLHY